MLIKSSFDSFAFWCTMCNIRLFQLPLKTEDNANALHCVWNHFQCTRLSWVKREDKCSDFLVTPTSSPPASDQVGCQIRAYYTWNTKSTGKTPRDEHAYTDWHYPLNVVKSMVWVHLYLHAALLKCKVLWDKHTYIEKHYPPSDKFYGMNISILIDTCLLKPSPPNYTKLALPY